MPSGTITIDNVPDGYELTGEFRPAQRGETYLNCCKGVSLGDTAGHYPILRKLDPPTPPAGYELTGEYRVPKDGEEYFCFENIVVFSDKKLYSPTINEGRRWILRKAWQAPAWMREHYKGCWLYKYMPTDWRVSHQLPVSDRDVLDTFSAPHPHTGISAINLAALHGETFTPPTHVNCLRIE